MQFFGVAALLAFLAVLYKERTARIVDILQDLLHNTTNAGYVELKWETRSGGINAENLDPGAPSWVHIVASRLDTGLIGIVINLQRAGRYRFPPALSNQLIELRRRGLHRPRPNDPPGVLFGVADGDGGGVRLLPHGHLGRDSGIGS